MEANELMIGDWGNIYVFPNENPQGKDLFPAKITAILTPTDSESFGDTIECMFTSLDGTGGVGYASRPPETFLPIALTKDILEKNGFKYQEEYEVYRCQDGDIVIEVGIYHPDFVNIGYDYTTPDGREKGEIASICKVNGANIYIHELQHTLRLCGIKKEIEI